MNRRRYALVAVGLCLSGSGLVIAQPAQRRASEPAGSLARFVPADCGMFLQIERPGEINATLRQAEAWRMLELALGVEREGSAPESTNWYDVLLAGVPSVGPAALLDLFQERVAFAGPAWSRFAEGVILFTPKDRNALKVLLDVGPSLSETRDGKVEVYELTGALRLAFDGQTAVLSRPRENKALFDRCVGLLKGDGLDSLRTAPLFAEQARRLPRSNAQGVFYFRLDHADSTSPAGGGLSGFGLWPELRGGLIGLYVRGSSLDFALRAAPSQSAGPDGPRIVLQRVHDLPRSTLAAWATAVNLDALFDRWSAPAAGEVDDAGSRPARFLGVAVDLERFKRDVVRKLGPRTMLVWGRTSDAEEGKSSLAILLESTDADQVKHALDATLTELAGAVNRASARDDEERLRLSSEEHLGAAITIVELADYAERLESEGLSRRLALTMRPCYAALDGWLIGAWNVDHLRELIAAHNGVRPVLGEFADVGGLSASRLGATALGVAQPATAAAVVGQWLDDAARDPHSILNPEFWEFAGEARGGGAGGGLGLGLKSRHRAGRVLVVKVYEDGPSQGLIQSGDEIVAVSGMALALDDANADLRRRLKETPGANTVALRLERAGELMDVSVPMANPQSFDDNMLAGAVRAMRRVQAVIRPLTLATFAVTQSDAERYSAQLRLRFSEGGAPKPASP